MELDQFLERDILFFLDAKLEKKQDKLKADREEEYGLYMTKDYIKELSMALDNDELRKARKLFDELKAQYNTLPANSLERKKVYAILEQMYEKIQNYVDLKERSSPLQRTTGESIKADLNFSMATEKIDTIAKNTGDISQGIDKLGDKFSQFEENILNAIRTSLSTTSKGRTLDDLAWKRYNSTDYLKEIATALGNDELMKGKKLFDELKIFYDSLPEDHPEKPIIKKKLEQIYQMFKSTVEGEDADLFNTDILFGTIKSKSQAPTINTGIVKQVENSDMGLDALNTKEELRIQELIQMAREDERKKAQERQIVDNQKRLSELTVKEEQRKLLEMKLREEEQKKQEALKREELLKKQKIEIQKKEMAEKERLLVQKKIEATILPVIDTKKELPTELSPKIYKIPKPIQKNLPVITTEKPKPEDNLKLKIEPTLIKKEDLTPKDVAKPLLQKPSTPKVKAYKMSKDGKVLGKKLTDNTWVTIDNVTEKTKQELEKNKALTEKSKIETKPVALQPQMDSRIITVGDKTKAELDQLYQEGLYNMFQEDYLKAYEIFNSILKYRPNNKAVKIRLHKCQELMKKSGIAIPSSMKTEDTQKPFSGEVLKNKDKILIDKKLVPVEMKSQGKSNADIILAKKETVLGPTSKTDLMEHQDAINASRKFLLENTNILEYDDINKYLYTELFDELYVLGLYTMFQNNFTEASKIFEKIIGINPKNRAAKIRLQECLEAMENA